MDRCMLTQEQLAALVAGETVKAEYSSPGEYGFVGRLEIELVPPAATDANSPDGGQMEDVRQHTRGGETPC